jgi:hypothetical protein
VIDSARGQGTRVTVSFARTAAAEMADVG